MNYLNHAKRDNELAHIALAAGLQLYQIPETLPPRVVLGILEARSNFYRHATRFYSLEVIHCETIGGRTLAGIVHSRRDSGEPLAYEAVLLDAVGRIAGFQQTFETADGAVIALREQLELADPIQLLADAIESERHNLTQELNRLGLAHFKVMNMKHARAYELQGPVSREPALP
jgi:hypothetical protein